MGSNKWPEQRAMLLSLRV